MDLRRKRVLVTGGASFIGSHLVDALIARGAVVRVVDDLSSGSLDNLRRYLERDAIEMRCADLREPGVARDAMADIDVVFHLAADHGGRGYVDRHQAGPASNLLLDGVVFREALRARVEKVVYASSGCVYPNALQRSPDEELFLREDMVGPPYDADNTYGWAKLMAEMTLRAYRAEHGLASVSLRYFTVYGPRGRENHAVMGMIARALVAQDPFEVWGDGRQVRNWTHVDDIVSGTLLAAERVDDATAINLGTTERTRVSEAVEMILAATGHRPRIVYRPEMPTGPLNRVADNRLAAARLGWRPAVPFARGVADTIDWYRAHRDLREVSVRLEQLLAER